jgi:Reverse transcriptase (RNA-dependent DNA polymerase)
LDFVQAFPQAPIETELFMDIAKGYIVGGNKNDYALKLIRNIYGQKQAGRVWNAFLVAGLNKIGFLQSAYDMCLLWKGQCILVIYTDDTIVSGPDKECVENVIQEISEEFTITSNDVVSDFLDVNISFDKEQNQVSFFAATTY